MELTAIPLADDTGGGYTYFKLRDLGKVLGFHTGWTREQGVFVESDKPYAEQFFRKPEKDAVWYHTASFLSPLKALLPTLLRPAQG